MTNSNINAQMVVIGIYILTGVMIYMIYIHLKPKRTKKWHIDGIPIIPAHKHLNESMDALICAPKMLRWLAKMEKTQVELKSIFVTDINWFSAKPDPKKLGFVKFSVGAIDKTTKKHIASNIVFLRGDSVAILIVVKVVSTGHKSKQYVLLCDQMRVASGGRQTEICAGMMDDEGNIASVALKEVKEETGFDIKHRNSLIELGSIFPSPGACDEEIFLYAWTTTITEEEFEEKQCSVFGNATEAEEIKLSFVPIKEMNNVLDEIKDVKAECAFRRYNDRK
jgi:ADP-sugar diphosphatase